MKLLPRNSEEPDVNLTPMIDVVFLLLLFFMVSTSFIRESSLKVDLPEASGQALTEEETPIDIIIRANGEVLVNETPIAVATRDALRDLLKTTAGDNADPHIIISADANAEYQHIVTAMDAAQLLGFTRLTLATRQKTAETP
ncbi:MULTISPECIES: biopolymer transporter ExbD [unclassified Methylophaga]|jgi:biopolymer transport protein ExbD|uniref:ExbD/TolR family protein n=2 Tax=Methylophaga TaxID=40222 RepID=UPI000C493314|nr:MULTISPECIES: biopolymer transporter ExbD [unclassified Methylophaga]MAL49399.1 biopolymer transporter ExbD [Methylophaga sp.]MAP26286.1 biopolymer transporter ExbD [Methylophaga sp.]MBP24675.1 biopolymer transporter ExbD [Methylophaga sp.]HAD30320.1 biopolymer transporter ExbD [Methylophaga sp.]HCC81418.1 biopolymer transporter ExbD [Methylophaga sp.]|tara:strand:+ start:7983 stop:8408 length:426 start_codon:yes stop_codon:yes gene_type:complete